MTSKPTLQALSSLQPTTCDMVMLILIVSDRLEISFVYSSDIRVPQSRSKNSVQNSVALLSHLANRHWIGWF